MAVASPPFSGFSPEAIQFLADLAANNDRAWFQPRKADYERLLKEPLEALVAALAERFEARGIPLQADPKRSPFRIYRDTRFSKDKTPVQDERRGQLPVGSRVTGRWCALEWRVLPLPARRDVRRRWDVDGREAYARRLPQKIIDDPDRVRAALTEPGFVKVFEVRTHGCSSGFRPGCRPITRWPTTSAGRTSCSGAGWPTTRCSRRSSPTRSPTGMRRRCRCSASSRR